MKTLKSLLRLISYHWWAYKKSRQLEPEQPQEKPEDKRNHYLQPAIGNCNWNSWSNW